MYAFAERLEPSDAQAQGLAQITDSVSKVNVSGSPEGVVSANPASLAHDRTNGDLWLKVTGTGNTGWQMITTSATDLYATPYIVDQADLGGNSFTTIQGAYDQAVLDGVTSAWILVRPGTYTENLSFDGNDIFPLSISGVPCVNQSEVNVNPVIIDGTVALTSGNFFLENLQIEGAMTLTNPVIFVANNCYFQSNLSGSGTAGIYAVNDSRVSGTWTLSESSLELYNVNGGSYSMTDGGLTATSCDISNVTLAGTSSIDARSCTLGTVSGTSSGAESNIFDCSVTSFSLTAGIVNFSNVRGSQTEFFNPAAGATFRAAVSSRGSVDFQTKTAANLTITKHMQYIGVTDVTTGAPRTLTLPSTASASLIGFRGQRWTIKDESGGAGANNITINTNGGNIDGAGSFVINTNYGAVDIEFDGTNYWVV